MKRKIIYNILAFLFSISLLKAKDNSINDNFILEKSNEFDDNAIIAHGSHASHCSHASHMSHYSQVSVSVSPKKTILNLSQKNTFVNFLLREEYMKKVIGFSNIRNIETLRSEYNAEINTLRSFGDIEMEPIDCVCISLKFYADPWNVNWFKTVYLYKRIIDVYVPILSSENKVYINTIEYGKSEVIEKFDGLQEVIDLVISDFYGK